MLFPFTRAGRQTLVYVALAGCGPVLTLFVYWAMVTVRDFAGAPPAIRLARFAHLADYIAVSLLIIVVALACFVSIRAVKIGKDGLEATANDNGEDQPTLTTVTATATVATPAGAPAPDVDATASPG